MALTDADRVLGQRLVAAVAGRTEVAADLILSRSRRGSVATARSLVAAALYDVAEWKMFDVAAFLGRDHSTISYVLANHRRRVRVDPELMEWDRDVRATALELAEARRAGCFDPVRPWSLPVPMAGGAA